MSIIVSSWHISVAHLEHGVSICIISKSAERNVLLQSQSCYNDSGLFLAHVDKFHIYFGVRGNQLIYNHS